MPTIRALPSDAGLPAWSVAPRLVWGDDSGGGSEQALAQRRTTLVSIAVAAVLVALKLGVGLATGSLGLISAGIESSGDVIAAVLTFFAVRLGGRPADRGHPYGHRRAENLGALGEAAILLAGGLLVSVEAIRRLLAAGRRPQIQLVSVRGDRASRWSST